MRHWDVRNPDFLWAQNELFDVFLPLIGVYGVVVYMALCRELPHRPDGRLSLREIKTKSLVSKTEVRRALDDMVALGMISERKPSKENSKSAFELLDLKAAAQVPLEELKGRLTHSASNQRNLRDEPSATAPETVPTLKLGTVPTVPPGDSCDPNRQCLRGSPEIATVPPRDRLPVRRPDFGEVSPGGTVSPSRPAQSELFLNTTTLRERENTGAREASPPVAALDLVHLAGLIVLAHPFARQRQWAESDVLVSDRTAAIAAARADAEIKGTTAEEAALSILEKVERIAREVPEDQWRWLKPIDKFLRLREYRMRPTDLYREITSSQRVSHARPEAQMGMSRTSDASTASDNDAAISYWRTVRERGSPLYAKDCPKWIRARLEQEAAAATGTQQNPAA